jgi:hypothetical protein
MGAWPSVLVRPRLQITHFGMSSPQNEGVTPWFRLGNLIRETIAVMPELKPCWDCGHRLSSEAKSCTNCMSRHPFGVRCVICRKKLAYKDLPILAKPWSSVVRGESRGDPDGLFCVRSQVAGVEAGKQRNCRFIRRRFADRVGNRTHGGTFQTVRSVGCRCSRTTVKSGAEKRTTTVATIIGITRGVRRQK